MAGYYSSRKSKEHFTAVKDAIEDAAYTRECSFNSRTYRPADFQPPFCRKDIALISVQNQLDTKDADKIWETTHNMFRNTADRDEQMTGMFDMLMVRFNRFVSEDEFLEACKHLCKPVCPFLQVDHPTARPRTLEAKRSDASDGSDGLGFLLAACEEASEEPESPSKPETEQPKEKKPKVDPDPVPPNISSNLIAIAAILLFQHVPIQKCVEAQALKRSPDCPKMIKNLAGAPVFNAIWERSEAWAAKAQEFTDDYNKAKESCDRLKTMGKSAREMSAMLLSCGQELASKITLGKKFLFEFDVAVFISSVHEVGDLLSKYESCHMDPEQRNMLLDMKSLSQEIFSDWVSTHGAVIVSALRHFSPDWSGIVDTEAFRTKAHEGMQELEGLKALSEAVCKQLDGPKAEDQRLVFLKDEPCQSHFRWWAAWLHCALNLRAAHLRSVDKLHEVKIVSDLQQVFARYNAMNGHKSIEWAFQRDGVIPSSRDPLWRRKPLVSKDDAKWLHDFLENNNQTRQKKVEHRRNPSYTDFFLQVGNDRVGADKRQFCSVTEQFSPTPIHSKTAWIEILSDRTCKPEVFDDIRKCMLPLSIKLSDDVSKHEAWTYIDADPQLPQQRKTAMTVAMNMSNLVRQVHHAVISWIGVENRIPTKITDTFLKAYTGMIRAGKNCRATNELQGGFVFKSF